MFGFVPRSLAVVGIVGALTFAMPVSAQAELLDPLTLGPYVIGAVRAAAPVEATAGVIGPEGTIIVTAAVMAGALAYATQDTWMPWLQGLFGQGGTQSSVGGAKMSLSWAAGTPSALNGAQILVHWADAVSVSTKLIGSYHCRSSIGTLTGGIVGTGVAPRYAGTSGDWLFATCASDSVVNDISVQSVNGNNYADVYSNLLTWGQPFDPKTGATYTVSSDCVKPDGTLATITATTANPGLGGLLVPSCVAAFGPGSHATKFTLNGAATGTTPRQLWTKPLPTDAQTAVLYPNCVGAGAIACTYIVKYQGVACAVAQAECVNWTLRQLAHPADYSCFYGPYALPSTDSCAIDERVYEPNGVRLTMKNTDGDPWTYDSPAPAGMPEPVPAPVAAPAPVAPPVGAPGGDPVPVPVVVTPTTATATSCWPSGSAAWNPVSWVMQPVQCALLWAFKPSAVDGSPIRTELDRAGIGPSVTALSTAVGSLGGTEGGCSGPSVSFDIATVHQVVTPFAACTAPMSTVASFAYAFVSVVTVLGGAGKIIASIGAGFGFGGPPPTWQQGTLF